MERVARPVWGVRPAAAAADAATAAPPRDEAATPRRSQPLLHLDHHHALCTHAYYLLTLLSVLFYLFGGMFIRTFIIQTVTRDYSYKTNIYPTIQTINDVSNFVCD